MHRYPHCWRCDTPLIWRVTDDWLIAVDELRQPLLEANATVEWTPAYMGKRMDDWLRNMGDWNISRRRYYGLPLPFYPCALRAPERGRLARPSSRSGRSRGLDQLEELRRPWIDEVPIRCAACGEDGAAHRRGRRRLARRRHRPVLDARLGEPGVDPAGLRDRRREGAHHRRPAGPRVLGAVVPGRLGLGDARADPALVLLAALHVGGARSGGRRSASVLGYEKMLDERGREMHGSWGNMIDAEDAFARMGADVMRWQYCAQPPNQNLLFGFGPAHEIQRKLLTLWNSAKFLVDYANIDRLGGRAWADLASGPAGELEPLDRWLVARTHALVAEATAGYESWLTVDVVRAYEAFVDDVSNWYIRRSRRRFWDGDAAALRTLWYALVQGLRVVAPLMPFLTDHLWRVLTAPCAGAPESVHLAGWPEAAAPDAELLAEIAELRRVVELGRQARATSGVKLRQPLRVLVVEGARRATGHADEIADELRVGRSSFGHVDASELRVKPNLPVLGPKLGKELGAVRAALQEGEFEELPDGGIRVAGHDLTRDEVLVEREGKEGWAVAASDGLTVALDLHARRRAAARRARLRPHPRGEQDAQGAGPRADRPHPAHDPRGGLRPARAPRVDHARDARGLGRGDRDGACASTRPDWRVVCSSPWRSAGTASARSRANIRYCPWCAAPQRRKLVEFFRGADDDEHRALRVSRYLPEQRVRFSVWDESGTAPAAVVTLDEEEAERLAEYLARPARRPGAARGSPRARPALALGELELAAELDGQAEGDVLLHDPVRLDARDAARAEPVADAIHELLRCRGARCDPDDTGVGEPRLVDLGLVVDQVGGRAGCA